MYQFKSRATGDLIMLEANGQQVLSLIGKEDSVAKGILLPEQMTAAVVALEAAVAQEEAELAQRVQAAKAKGEAPPRRRQGISLRQRVAPLITMMQRCQKADAEIVWGV
jgi:Domain of unknown function (DUF1840)